MQLDWLNSALSPVVYGDIALSINTQYNCAGKMILCNNLIILSDDNIIKL